MTEADKMLARLKAAEGWLTENRSNATAYTCLKMALTALEEMCIFMTNERSRGRLDTLAMYYQHFIDDMPDSAQSLRTELTEILARCRSTLKQGMH